MTTFFDRLKGYKTVVVNSTVLLGGILTLFGVNLPGPTLAAE